MASIPPTQDPTNAALLQQQLALFDRVGSWLDQEYAFAFGTVGGGPNGDGTYPFTNLKTGEIVFRKCAAQLAFDATKMPVIKLQGGNTLTLVAAHNGCKVLPFNGTNAIQLTFGPDIRTGFNCLVEQYQTGKIHFVASATSALHSYPDKYEYTAGRYATVSVTCDEAPSNINQIVLAGGLTNIP
jgi:hypothetical protein